ncbi:DUF6351 family protein [Thalassolituus sp. LLYu03]|uniref:DUF6351 family protein n=1 Tax=Thalassolituus sp. LLYu03 TaxID=3421656 RepID=UPI003D2E753B
MTRPVRGRLTRARINTIVLVILLLLAGSTGIGYHFYQQLRHEAGLDSAFPQVVGIPPGNRLQNLPPWSGTHPSVTPRPAETFTFPIEFGATGPVEPLFAGTNQYPFLCQTEESGLGQPLTDNISGWGIPVYSQTLSGERSPYVIGYSKDCSLPTRVHYLWFRNRQESFPRREDDHLDPVPDDHELLIRAESGTINRFMYVLLMPTTKADQLNKPDISGWNGKLIYYFRGGISIGFQQGKISLQRLARDMRVALEQGYAVVYSSANETDNTYNIRLQEDTALRVKRQFVARYGEPLFTIGIGGSGGGLQQYLYAQNQPGIIDGGVALIAFPDMVTQLHYTLDCELLEYYFDHLASHPERWLDATKRQSVLGLSVTADKPPRLNWLTDTAQMLRLQWPGPTPPGSECNSGWRGSVPLVNNPNFHSDYHRFTRSVREQTYWTHWQDNRAIYGTDDEGRSPSVWSNRGVQYGLQALLKGQISSEEFLELNSRVGGWKDAKDMIEEYYWHLSGDPRLYRFTPYGEQNMSHEGRIREPAARYNGNLAAAKAAYLSGNVFMGRMSIPVMDVRMYLDHELNIHHTWAALSTRLRLQQAGTDIRLNPIWTSTKPYNPMWDGIRVMDEWLTNARSNGGDLIAARPEAADDRCLDGQGNTIASGASVWDGEWNQQADGACTQIMPFNQGSRQVAGDSLTGFVFQCALIPVSKALHDGTYGTLDLSPYQEKLEAIFPDGVCDYRQPDLALPDSMKSWLSPRPTP